MDDRNDRSHPWRRLLSPARIFEEVDPLLVRWMAENGLPVLRVSLGVVFLWFGLLKLFPGMSPEEELVRHALPFVPPALLLPLLGLWEAGIGLGLVVGRWMRLVLLLLFLQMAGTALPLVAVPEVVWKVFPFGLSLEGQYIVKNLVLIGAGLVLGGTVQGGRIDPGAIRRRNGGASRP
jgi:uncharacterized membrane protein YphA (DoxX/SURF4 family)